jgi:hypothetical protein
MLRTSLLWLCLAAVGSLGCSQEGPQRAPVSGRVTIGGQPLAAGRILFIPAAPTSGPAASARITDGTYRLSEAEGPVVGTQRVEIEADLNLGFAIDDEAAFARRAQKPWPKSPIPPAFGRESRLTVTIEAGCENQFDVAIPGRQSAQWLP